MGLLLDYWISHGSWIHVWRLFLMFYHGVGSKCLPFVSTEDMGWQKLIVHTRGSD